MIVISFVGYTTQELKWNGQSLNVTLKDDTQALENFKEILENDDLRGKMKKNISNEY